MSKSFSFFFSHFGVPEEFHSSIQNEVDRMDHRLIEAAKNQPCFGHMFMDEEGVVCPESDCVLRENCSNSYFTAKVEMLRIVNEDNLRKMLPAKQVEPAPVQPTEDDKTKYVRETYVSLGRPVDEFIASLVHKLKYPPSLPKNWSHTNYEGLYGKTPLMVSRTMSYHAFLYKGRVVVRFWTNAAKLALVDLDEKLFRYARNDGYEILAIPANSFEKIKPCTGRIYCRNTDTAEKIGEWMIKAYELDRQIKAEDKAIEDPTPSTQGGQETS